MYRHQENSYTYVDYDEPMLGPVDDDYHPPEADPNDVPNKYDQEVNRVLDEVLDEVDDWYLPDKSKTPTKKYETHEDIDHVRSDIWYKNMVCKIFLHFETLHFFLSCESFNYWFYSF